MDPPLPPTTGGTPTRALTFDPASTTSPIVLQKAAAAAERRRRQQPSSAACKVFVRVRPAKQDAALDSTIEVSGTTLRARAPVDSMASRHHRDAATECAKEYSFTGVFDPTSTQEDVYDVAFKDSVDALFVPSGAGGHLRGHRSALLFCFGPSNSGKTYTVVGDGGVGAPARGVLIRAIENVLAQLNDEERCVEWSPLTTRVEVHFVEVHNEAVYDLLATPATGKAARRGFGTGRKKTVRPQLKVYGRGQIQDVVTVEVNDVASAMETMQRGLERRAVCNNEINSSSSRSHSIFTLRLVHRDAAVAARTSIQLTVVDLAGSERSKRTSGVSGSVREEAANINQSLTTLMKVIRARRETRGGYASFRESMLTRILEPLLCGAKNLSSSVMIANVSPDELDYDEAIATLNHAAITSKNVVVEARPVKKPVVHAKYDSNGHLIVEGGAEKKKRSSRGSGRQRRGSNGKRSSGSSTGRTSIEGEGEEAELVVPLQHRAKRSGSAYVKRTKLATFKQQARGGDRAQIAEIARIHAECEAKIEVQKEEALEFTARRLAALDLEHDRALEAELEAAMRRAAALTELQMRNERDTRMKSNRKLSQKDRMVRAHNTHTYTHTRFLERSNFPGSCCSRLQILTLLLLSHAPSSLSPYSLSALLSARLLSRLPHRSATSRTRTML